MVYSSSLMEANFFTIAQRREVDKEIEAENRRKEIEQLNMVSPYEGFCVYVGISPTFLCITVPFLACTPCQICVSPHPPLGPHPQR